MPILPSDQPFLAALEGLVVEFDPSMTAEGLEMTCQYLKNVENVESLVLCKPPSLYLGYHQATAEIIKCLNERIPKWDRLVHYLLIVEYYYANIVIAGVTLS